MTKVVAMDGDFPLIRHNLEFDLPKDTDLNKFTEDLLAVINKYNGVNFYASWEDQDAD